MKRSVRIILSTLVLSLLCACALLSNGPKEPVSFYYTRPRDEYESDRNNEVIGKEDAVIVSEQREAEGHRDDLNYLLSQYLRGPQDINLMSPFPDRAALTNVVLRDDTLFVTLTEEFASLSGIDLTVACACLTRTCLSITEASQVTIAVENSLLDGAKSITMSESTLLLLDSAVAQPE